MFYNENELFEIRLNQHWDSVDYFVVVEAGETHTGLKKPLNFDHERFKPWASKIIYRSFDSFDEEYIRHPELLDNTALMDRGPLHTSADWTRDHFQYNYLLKVMLDNGAKDNDLVYLSCCDEIIRKEAFELCTNLIKDNPDHTIMFKYNLFAYKLNLLCLDYTRSDSSGGFSTLASLKRTLPATLRFYRITTHLVQNAGWHFTFLDPTDGERVLSKQRAWAHSKDVYEGRKLKFDHTTKEEAMQRFYEDYPITKVDITLDSHPEYIVNNLEKFKDFIQL